MSELPSIHNTASLLVYRDVATEALMLVKAEKMARRHRRCLISDGVEPVSSGDDIPEYILESDTTAK